MRRNGEPGAQVKVVERDDGVIELHPHVPVPADQAWFWAQRWQAREREVEAQVEAGDTMTHDSADDLLVHLDALAAE